MSALILRPAVAFTESDSGKKLDRFDVLYFPQEGEQPLVKMEGLTFASVCKLSESLEWGCVARGWYVSSIRSRGEEVPIREFEAAYERGLV
ncbi:MAG: hypothetical protein AAF226_02990 [Verrucomicrobiota bacterium]